MLEPTRALIIEDDSDYEALLRQFLNGRFDVQSARTLAGGLATLQHFRSDVILVDLNLPDSAGYMTFLRVCEAAQGAAVIVLTGVDEDQLAVKAIEDGAQDYLVKNSIEPSLLPRYIRMAMGRHSRACAQQRPGAAGLVLGFIGSKGGVGTSTVAVNVAALLAQGGADTAFVEFGGGPGAASLYMQSEPANNLSRLLEGPAHAITAACLRQCAFEPVPGLRMIWTQASAGIPAAIGAEHARTITAAARALGTHVVLDLPSRVDEGVAVALAACDALCMVVDREPSSVQGAAAMLRRIGSTPTRGGEISIVEVERTRLEHRFDQADFRRQLKEPLAAIRSAEAAICVSHSARIPLVSLYPENPFSLNIRDLAGRLLGPLMPGVCTEPFGKTTGSKSYWRTIPETTYS